jgi:hypothetical protein
MSGVAARIGARTASPHGLRGRPRLARTAVACAARRQCILHGAQRVGEHGARTSSFEVGGPPGMLADAARSDAIAEGRRIIQALVPSSPVWLDQVHGATVVDVDRLPRGAGDRWPRADAAVTRANDVVLAIRVADCLPALFTAADGSVSGAAHAGWRGLAAGPGRGLRGLRRRRIRDVARPVHRRRRVRSWRRRSRRIRRS